MTVSMHRQEHYRLSFRILHVCVQAFLAKLLQCTQMCSVSMPKDLKAELGGHSVHWEFVRLISSQQSCSSASKLHRHNVSRAGAVGSARILRDTCAHGCRADGQGHVEDDKAAIASLLHESVCESEQIVVPGKSNAGLETSSEIVTVPVIGCCTLR